MASRRFSVRRKNRKTSRRRQRGGANLDTTTSIVPTTTSSLPTTTKTVVINCALDKTNKVIVTSPPEGITINSAALTSNNLVFTSNKPIIDMKFSKPNGNLDLKKLGTPSGISIHSAPFFRVPISFTLATMSPSHRRIDSTNPISGQVTIRNLNTANLGLNDTNRSFTITLTTL